MLPPEIVPQSLLIKKGKESTLVLWERKTLHGICLEIP